MAGGISSSPIPELTLVVRTLNKSFNSQWDVWPLLLPIPESKGCWVTPQAGWLRMGSRSVPPCTLNQGSRLANRTAVIRNKLSQQEHEWQFNPARPLKAPAQMGHKYPMIVADKCYIAGAGVCSAYSQKDYSIKDRV